MLKETRLALRISATAYDPELVSLIQAGAADLAIAGIDVEGLYFSVTDQGVTDESTLDDALIKRAIITYVRMHFGSPADYERLKSSYDEQKAQLQVASGYGRRINL